MGWDGWMTGGRVGRMGEVDGAIVCVSHGHGLID